MTVSWYGSPAGPWQSWFAVKPVRDIHGSWHWLRRIYRRKRNIIVYPDQGWEYGTVFDVVRDPT